MVQAAREASQRGKDAGLLSTIPFYKDTRVALDAVQHATTPLAENQ